MKRPFRFIAFILVICLIFSVVALPVQQSSPAFAQSSVQATVAAYGLNVRLQAGTETEIVGAYPAGLIVSVEGREANARAEGLWVFSHYPETGLRGWVLSSYLRFPFGFDVNSLPVTDAQGQRGVAPIISAPPPPASGDAAPVSVEGALSGTTAGAVNFRSGPGTGYSAYRQLALGTQVAITGRNSNNTWYRVVVNGQEGWLFATLVSVTGDINSLPVVADAPATGGGGGASAPVGGSGATIPGIITNIGSRSRQIFQVGQALGNRADVFSKVGDSISHSDRFLTPIGVGGLQIGNYTSLQPVIDYFMRSSARTNNSFANQSLATGGGWTTYSVLDSRFSLPGTCQPGETPLACEYRVVKPALALIMFGTNDAAYLNANEFTANLQIIVQISIDMGVIPVLSSIPDNLASPAMTTRAQYFNSLIRSVAVANGVPFWDYWLSLQNLPNKGVGGDGLHPSINPATNEAGIFTPDQLQYGMNMRNLTALMVLDAIWRQVLSR